MNKIKSVEAPGDSVKSVIRDIKVCIGLNNIEKSLERDAHLNRLKGGFNFCFPQKLVKISQLSSLHSALRKELTYLKSTEWLYGDIDKHLGKS